MISVNADFLLQSFVIPIFLILPEFILSSFLTQSLLLEFSSCLSSDFLKRRSFSFNMPWRYQISITKCLYSSREDLPKKLFKITVQEGKKTFSVKSHRSKTSLLKFPGNVWPTLTENIVFRRHWFILGTEERAHQLTRVTNFTYTRIICSSYYPSGKQGTF